MKISSSAWGMARRKLNSIEAPCCLHEARGQLNLKGRVYGEVVGDGELHGLRLGGRCR